jgi:hypothetical protein
MAVTGLILADVAVAGRSTTYVATSEKFICG